MEVFVLSFALVALAAAGLSIGALRGKVVCGGCAGACGACSDSKPQAFGSADR